MRQSLVRFCLLGLIGAIFSAAPTKTRAQDEPTDDVTEILNAPAPTPAPRSEGNAQKTVWTANLLRRTTAANRIDALEITETKLPVWLVPKGQDLRPTIKVRGRLTDPRWRLVVQDRHVPLKPDTREFVVSMYLRGRLNEATLIAVGPDGEKQTETIYVYAPEAMQFKVVSAWDHILVTLAPAFLNYQQTDYGTYQSIAMKLGLRYATPETKIKTTETESRFGLLGSVNATLFTLQSSPVERGPQLIEAKGDATFALKNEGPWLTQAFMGASYLTMFANGSSFGFENLIAPEFGVRVRKTIDARTAWIGDARWVALSPPLAFNEYGLNLQLAWSRFIKESRRIEIGASLSSYSYHPTDLQTVKLQELCLSFGISF